METSLEGFFVANFLMDTMLIAVAARSCGIFKPGRILITSIISAAFAILAFLYPFPWKAFPVQIVLLVFIAHCLAGRQNLRTWSLCVLILISGSALSGGMGLLANRNRMLSYAGIFAGLLMLCLLLSVRRNLRTNWQVEILLRCNNREARFPALIDTGNRLHEPLSGLPVLIVEEYLVEAIMPDSGFKRVAFGALGGNGSLMCFLPDQIWIIENKTIKRCPDAWIGICPHPLPGASRALAPCEFASIP